MMHHQILAVAIGVNAKTDDTPVVVNPIHIIRQIKQSNIHTATVEQYALWYNALVNYYKRFGDFATAVKTLDAAILTLQTKGGAEDDHLAEFYIRKAAMHLKAFEVEAAICDYARSIVRDPMQVNPDFEQEILERLVPPVYTSDITGEDSDDSGESLLISALTYDLYGRQQCQENPEAAKLAFTVAIDAYTKMLDHKALDADLKMLLRDRRGQLYLSVDLPEAAEQDFSSLVNSNPNSAGYYFHRALSRLALTFYEDAFTDFNRAIELAPRSHRIARLSHDRAAYISLLYENHPSAIFHWTTAIQTAPEDLSLKVKLALALYRNQNYAASIHELAEIEAGLETLDATEQKRLQRDIDRLKVRMPIQKGNPADPTAVKNRRDRFREVVELTDIESLDVDEQCEISELGFQVVVDEWREAA